MIRTFRHITHIAAICIALMAVATSCRSKSTVVSPPAAETMTVGSASDMQVALRNVVDSYGSWDKMRLPMSIEMSSPKSISISGTLTMQRGKDILISLKYFGFEVAQIYASNDSIMVIDKYNKQYAAEPIASFLGGADLDISNIQDLLTGRVFNLGKSKFDVDKAKKSEFELQSPTQWLLLPTAEKGSGVEYGFLFSPAEVLSAIVIKSGAHNPVSCDYSGSAPTSFGPMAPSVRVEYATAKSAIEAKIKLDLSKARWNGDVELRRQPITSKYKRIDSSKIEAMIKKL